MTPKAEIRVHRVKWTSLRFTGAGQSKESRTWPWETPSCPAIATKSLVNSPSDCTESWQTVSEHYTLTGYENNFRLMRWLSIHATKSDNLSFTCRIHFVEGENRQWRVFLLPPQEHCDIHTCAHTKESNTHQITIFIWQVCVCACVCTSVHTCRSMCVSPRTTSRSWLFFLSCDSQGWISSC